MLIIGEKLNSSIPKVREAIHNKDKAFIQDLALKQVQAGADYLDVNTALEDEVNDMEWVIKAIKEVVDVPICIDSTNPEAVKKALELTEGKAMINSINMESARIRDILPIVIDSGCPVIALTIDDNGIPKTVEDRMRILDRMVEILQKHNYDLDKVYVDPLVLPVATDTNNALIFFESLTQIKEKYGLKTVSGLSNVSHSLPKRRIINRHFLTVCISRGMDAAILDPLDKKIITAILTTELLMGKDRFARKYLKAHREGILEE
ncbi:methyltetrahydrofolate--corrinoid methyltransferase [Carboxydothermus ferrireducens]|uniref:5-methyltetrahydrofolate--homocysteine methyltransferase n=1 Tax=Carboxydothermus ferrireducens DSM 11255 TaxID=1119529 RepID=A0ABX2RBS1_9THEO|nr:methyltetrahydrofolate--corrinoid methyltransferase [Carboxydothermus ferrireducens]NYE57508.1 5-methyltetrahydrofolate--homocysteine methyltransferase [Carboxydothermus ferrireducens DSM 11255]